MPIIRGKHACASLLFRSYDNRMELHQATISAWTHYQVRKCT